MLPNASQLQLYLASTSPRRRELLQQIGIAFKIVAVEIDESQLQNESPESYVARMAQTKAEMGWTHHTRADDLPVLAADTIVHIDNAILGKPKDRAHGIAMLKQLSGRRHEVLTAISIKHGAKLATRTIKTQVVFRQLEPHEIAAYWDSGEPADKAGGYAIQGYGAVFVQHLSGSYSGVVGLPLCECVELLSTFGISPLSWIHDTNTDVSSYE